MSKPMTDAERELYFWQYYPNNLGGFKLSLWNAISKADGENQKAIALGFPDEVKAYQRFSNEAGYWESVKIRMEEF